jgi:hypothetical protein
MDLKKAIAIEVQCSISLKEELYVLPLIKRLKSNFPEMETKKILGSIQENYTIKRGLLKSK